MGRTCATVQNYFRLLDQAPNYRRNQGELAALTSNARMRAAGARAPFPRIIPVVVHLIFANDADELDDQQVVSQIDVLNADYGGTNDDLAQVPEPFKPFIGKAGLRFVLAPVAPSGAETTGITRTRTDVTAFSPDDAMKSAATGGADAWDTERYLNIWVCRLSGGLLGYAQFPGGPSATDGVVIGSSCFGIGGRANAPFDLGRTATHEVGHWLNLSHIWGEERIPTCDDIDDVEDTPNQLGPNTGDPVFPTSSCPGQPHGDMFMNYMDYVNDASMFMFSVQQVERMHAALEFSRANLGVGMTLGEQRSGTDYLLDKVWVRSPEEEGPGERVFRPEGFPLPPVRARERVLFREDGSIEALHPGADDRPASTLGRWALTDDAGSTGLLLDLDRVSGRMSVVEIAADRLRLAKRASE
jgi:hypothetical protein